MKIKNDASGLASKIFFDCVSSDIKMAFAETGHKISVIKISGKSMEDLDLMDGGYVVYSVDTRPEPGELVIIDIDTHSNKSENEILIKKLDIRFGKLVLKSANQNYKDYTFQTFRNIKVIGKPLLYFSVVDSSDSPYISVKSITDDSVIKDYSVSATRELLTQ
jgi:hypothetical protein